MTVTALDIITAHEIEVMCRIGCTEAERAFTQRLLVTISAGVDTRRAASTLNLEDSVCYATMCQAARELGQGRSWVLVEEYAEHLAALVLSGSALVQSIEVEIKKFALPGVAWTGVKIARKR